MNKLLLIAGVVGLVSMAGYLMFSPIGDAPVVATKDGIQAQVQRCIKGPDNMFHITALITASPKEVKLHRIGAEAGDWSGMGWSGEVILMKDGEFWSSYLFRSREGIWTATASFKIPLIVDPNYNCELDVLALIIKPDV